MTRQEYNNSIREENDTIDERQYHSHPITYQSQKSNDNSIQSVTLRFKDKEDGKSNCNSLNSAFRVLNQNRNDISNTRTIQQGSPYLIKRKRDESEVIIANNKKPKIEENEIEKKDLSSNVAVENISLNSYASCLSNKRDNKLVPEGKKYKNMKSLEEIKEEVAIKRKEEEKQIDAFKQKNDSIQNTKQLYEEKKKKLIDYYHEKAQSLKEVTMMMERERIKKESNFNHLQLSKNEMISIKAKEKSKPKEEIIKQTGLFIDKVNKPKVDKMPINNGIGHNSKLNNQQLQFQQEDKKEISFGLSSDISFGPSNSMLNSGIGNLFNAPKEENDEKPKNNNKSENNLFPIGFLEKNNTSFIDFKPDPSNFGESSFSKKPSIQNDNKAKEKSFEKPLFGSLFADNKEANDKNKSISLFEDNKASDNHTPSNNSNNPFASFTGFTGLTDKTNKDNQTPNANPASNNNQKQTEKSPQTSLNLFNNNPSGQSSTDSTSLFNQKEKTLSKSNDTSIFKSNNPVTDKIRETSVSNPLLSTPNLNNHANDEQIKQTLENNESIQGSLFNDKNPFNNSIKTQITNVFKSPAKPNTQTGSLNQNQPQLQTPLFNQPNSLFSPNKITSQPNSTIISSLFTPNSFLNPVTQGNNQLGVPQKSLFT